MNARRRRVSAGFNLIEMLVVLAIIMVIALLGFPALDRAIQRARIESTARQASSLMQMARINALKRGAVSGVAVRYDTGQVIAFNDINANLAFDVGTDTQLGEMTLPRQVSFWGPTDGAADGANALNAFYNDGANGGEVYFNSDGSVAYESTRLVAAEIPLNASAIRFRDTRDNFLEAAAGPPGTGRVMVRKYTGSGAATSAANWENAADGWQWN